MSDYLSRFKSERDVVFRIWGNKFLDGFSEMLPDWDNTWTDADKNEFFQNEPKKYVAVLFLRNADYHSYNELMVEYRKSYRKKLNTYPKSLEDVVAVMRQVQPEKSKKSNNRKTEIK